MTDNVTVSKKKQKYNNNDINNGKNNGDTAGKKKKQKDRHASSRPYSNLSMEELKMLTDYHLSGIHNGVSFIIQDGDAAAAANDAKDAAANQSSITRNINHYKHENIDNETGTMSPAQMHELSRLLASWSKLELNSQLQQVLSRREKSLAADMAETCLSKLLEEKEAGNGKVMITADMYHNVSNRTISYIIMDHCLCVGHVIEFY